MKQKPETTAIPDANAVWRILGLAVRARQAVTGAEAAEQAMRRQKACLILLADDASDNTCQDILWQCRQMDIPALRFGSKADMGHWTGHTERAVIAILSRGFAERVKQLISAMGSQAEAGRQSAE